MTTRPAARPAHPLCLAAALAAAGAWAGGPAHPAAVVHQPVRPAHGLTVVGRAHLLAPGVASTGYSEVRLTLSPDGRTALWFSRDRPASAGRPSHS